MFHLEKLKDLTCVQEYAVTVSNWFGVLDTLEDPEELWDTFNRETLEAAKECIGERPRSQSGFTSVKTLESIEESRAARLAGDHDQYRALSRRTRTLLRRDKERYVSALAEDVECHLNAQTCLSSSEETLLQVYFSGECYQHSRWLPCIGRRWADSFGL